MDAGRRPSLNWPRVAGWALSLAAFGFVGRWLWQLDRSTWIQLTELHPGFLLLALGFFLVWFWLRFLGWQFISRRHGYQASTAVNIRMWALSEFMRYIPGNIWSFAARWRGATSQGVTRGAAIQALVIEALGLVGGAVVVAGVLGRPDWWWSGPVGILLYLMFVPLLFRLGWRRRNQSMEMPNLSRLELTKLIGLYTLTWVLFGLATAAVYYSFPNPPPMLITQLIGYSVLAWLLGYVSFVTPMGLGVREAALVVLLTPTAGASFAALISVASRMWLVLSELIFVGVVMIRKR